MRRRFLLALSGMLSLCELFAQTANEGRFTLVDENGFNDLEITIEVSGDSDTQISSLSGTLDALLNIETGGGTTNKFVIQTAEVQASDVTFRLGFPPFGAVINTNDLAGTAATPIGLGPVDPATGEFAAENHTFTINSGTLDGSAFFQPIDVDVSEEPITGPGSGIGTILLSDPAPGSNFRIDYTVTIVLPVDFSDTVPTSDDGPDAEVDVAGLIKAVGSVSAYRTPTYDEWASLQGLDAGSQDAFSLNQLVPNGVIYALGYNSDYSPSSLYSTSPQGITFGLGEIPTRQALVIEASEDLLSWSAAPPSQFLAGSAFIPAGFTGEVTIAPQGGSRFFRILLAP